jgi:tyrosine-protein phosphatase YwqE
LASDAHDAKYRPPVLDEAWRFVEQAFGEDLALRLLEENPRAVLAGVPIAAAPLPRRKKKWYSPW